MIVGHKLVGTGAEKVIVMPGWFGDHTVFDPMLPYLDGARFTYGFVDYRGYGRSRDIAGSYTMAELAADAIALADHLGWQRFHAIGHSMGGKAIERIIVDAGGRVKSGVALTPVPATGAPMTGDEKALFEGAVASDENRRAIVDYSTGNRLSPAWRDWIVERSRITTTPTAFAGYLDAWANGSFADEIMGDKTPMLVAVGEHDAALTADVMRQTYLVFHPDAELQVIANSGHYPMQETPVYLATLVERFLAAHS